MQSTPPQKIHSPDGPIDATTRPPVRLLGHAQYHSTASCFLIKTVGQVGPAISANHSRQLVWSDQASARAHGRRRGEDAGSCTSRATGAAYLWVPTLGTPVSPWACRASLCTLRLFDIVSRCNVDVWCFPAIRLQLMARRPCKRRRITVSIVMVQRNRRGRVLKTKLPACARRYRIHFASLRMYPSCSTFEYSFIHHMSMEDEVK